MKVLMTGHTLFQCNIKRPVNHLYSGASALHYSLVNRLSAVHNKTPWEAMSDGINQYDVIMCGLYAVASISSYYGESCLLLLHEARKSGIPVVFYLDDWHLNLISSGYKNLSMPDKAYQLERHARLLAKNDPHVQTIIDNIGVIQGVMSDIYYGRYADGAMRVLIPMFPWCEDQLRQNVRSYFGWSDDQVVPYDPTYLFPEVYARTVSPDNKRREWVLSSRYDQSKFINHLKLSGMRWPVKSYGCRKNGDELLQNELDLPDSAYAPRWGVLSHSYPARLQGQWRNRFSFASQANSIIYCEGIEAGKGLVPDGGISTIEKMSNDDLEQLVAEQDFWLREHTWSCAEAEFTINRAIGDVM